MNTDIDYGPLSGLIGTWEGDKGMDIAPEPDGQENNPYFETIIFEPVEDDISNAETQTLVALHYRQIVTKKKTGKVFHDETGYWMWDAEAQTVMHSLTIPRGVCVLAGGRFDGSGNADGSTTFEVAAGIDDKDWGITQAPFMRDNARTTGFNHRITFGNGKLSYAETTIVDIYGKVFEHTDNNELQLV